MGTTKKGRRTIGIRDAKARLSQVLHDVRTGSEWVITERGKPIARLVPMADGERSLGERLLRLEANGTIEPGPVAPRFPAPSPVEFGLARRFLEEDRRR